MVGHEVPRGSLLGVGMTFLDWPIERKTSGHLDGRLKVIACRLLDRFSRAFADIDYDLFWDSSMINSQAWRQGGRKRVTVYGGLVRHPSLTLSGIALTIAHETGHHLGGRPLDPDLRWPTWQGQADYWAARYGMPVVFGAAATRLTLRGAKQIAALHQEFTTIDSEADIPASTRIAIFTAGALGKDISYLLEKAFLQMMNDRDL
jgi:hypothetical protein